MMIYPAAMIKAYTNEHYSMVDTDQIHSNLSTQIDLYIATKATRQLRIMQKWCTFEEDLCNVFIPENLKITFLSITQSVGGPASLAL